VTLQATNLTPLQPRNPGLRFACPGLW